MADNDVLGSNTILISEKKSTVGDSRRKNNIFVRGLRRARDRVGAAIGAAGKRISRGSRAEGGCGVRRVDGAAGEVGVRNDGDVGGCEEKKGGRVRGRVLRGVQRLLRREEPVRLTPVEGRMLLDE